MLNRVGEHSYIIQKLSTLHSRDVLKSLIQVTKMFFIYTFLVFSTKKKSFSLKKGEIMIMYSLETFEFLIVIFYKKHQEARCPAKKKVQTSCVVCQKAEK